ncbi:MAG: sigma-70 family RNA polymerase sigma factor [Myxococcales bacterium]|nr:sigma-70 family RNA polymerase sigma factor [Myxococcales bacterium]
MSTTLETRGRDQLIAKHTDLVRIIALQVKRTLIKNIELEDLMSYGQLGLIEAAERFDPGRGIKFKTYAYYRVKGAVYDGLRSMGWFGRTDYHRFQYQTHACFDYPAEPSLIVNSSGDKFENVHSLAVTVEGLVVTFITTLNSQRVAELEDDQQMSAEGLLEAHQTRQWIDHAIAQLPDQEQVLVRLYYYQEMSLEEVGKRLGLSKSWTSRLHARAIKKLGRMLRSPTGPELRKQNKQLALS